MATAHEESHELPSPIPWLGKAGIVEPLDRRPSSRVVASSHASGGTGRELPIAEPKPVPARAPTPMDEPPPNRRRLPIAPGQVVPPRPASPPTAPDTEPRGPVSFPIATASSAPRREASSSLAPAPLVGSRTPASSRPLQAAPERATSAPGRQASALPLIAASTPTKTRAPAKKKRAGSGIPARPIIRKLVWARRGSQVFFIGLFFFLLCNTAFRGTFSASSDTPVRLPWPVEGFLLTDPFVAAMTLLSTHAVYRGLAWSLVVVGLTLTFGRVFCGWICPFGTLHHFTAWLFPSRYVRGKQRVEANHTKGWQLAKYYLMIAFLASAVVGSAVGGLFDPICVAVRAIGLGVLPALQYLGIRVAAGIADTNVRALQTASDASQDFLARTVWTSSQLYFHQTWFITFLLIATLFMNRFIPRFWCRALCPLGAFLGVMSRFALFGMEKDHAKCTDCNLCLVHCQGADSPQGGVKHRQDECHMCLNCESACPEDVIKFTFLPNRRGTTSAPDLGRRTALATAAAGAVAIPVFRIADWPDKAYSEKVIRPPGAVEEREFLDRCIRCAECMKVCPNNALHPAFFEGGIEGLWTPILIPRIGYCEFSCVLCGQVCPTGAIQKITEKQKMGVGQKPVSMGTAMYDHGRCLPWAMATPCIVCEEFCPTSPKAIWAEEVEVPKRESHYDAQGVEAKMTTVKLKRPHVDPTLCIGCGACEKVCPIVDKPAVYVTNAGETRSKTNVILLENTSYNRT